METIDIEASDEEFLAWSKAAHELGLSFNEFVYRAVSSYLIKLQQEELDALKVRMAEAKKLVEQVYKRIGKSIDGLDAVLDNMYHPQGE